jgi:hypothetical protein
MVTELRREGWLPEEVGGTSSSMFNLFCLSSPLTPTLCWPVGLQHLCTGCGKWKAVSLFPVNADSWINDMCEECG